MQTKTFLKIIPAIRHFLKSIPLTTWGLGLGLGLFFWMLVFGRQGLSELERLRQSKLTLQNEEEQLLKEKGKLEEELKRLKNPHYLKHLIHKDLGYVEENELMIKFRW